MDDDGDLTSLKIGVATRLRGEVFQNTAVDGFVCLGELARHDRATAATQLRRHVVERVGDPVWRFEKYQRASLVRQACELGAALTVACRQKAFKTEPAGGKPRHRERRGDGGRARNSQDLEAGAGGLAHQFIAGIGQQRRAGITHQGNVFSRFQAREQVRDPLRFIVGVQ